jgi:hypothetical protein
VDDLRQPDWVVGDTGKHVSEPSLGIDVVTHVGPQSAGARLVRRRNPANLEYSRTCPPTNPSANYFNDISRPITRALLVRLPGSRSCDLV